MLNKFFRWLDRKIEVALRAEQQPDGEQPHFFYDKEIRREYIWIQNTPTGSIVEHTHWDSSIRNWSTESRVAANGESVEQAITLLRVQAALKCQS